ncbi:MAG TPA: hypothetical protein VJZ27_08560 [Aggregatilineales bacterium]|nr:hypothetical protein [Aggregatilineales bacterium]
MSDLYNKIVSERGTLENLASKIPGFSGYMEMSGRREADRMIRDHIAKRVQTLIDRFSSIERDIISGSGIGLMEKTKSIKTRIENFRRRLATDMPGYSGFFAANKIGPDELQRIYAFDEAMLRYTDEIAEKLDSLNTSVMANEGTGEALMALDAKVNEANQAYDLRDDVLNGIS